MATRCADLAGHAGKVTALSNSRHKPSAPHLLCSERAGDLVPAAGRPLRAQMHSVSVVGIDRASWVRMPVTRRVIVSGWIADAGITVVTRPVYVRRAKPEVDSSAVIT